MTTTHRLVADRLDWRPVEGEVVALDRGDARYLAVNPAGAVLWPALVAGATTEQLVDRLTAEFPVDRDRALVDIEAFLADLAGRGLLAP